MVYEVCTFLFFITTGALYLVHFPGKGQYAKNDSIQIFPSKEKFNSGNDLCKFLGEKSEAIIELLTVNQSMAFNENEDQFSKNY